MEALTTTSHPTTTTEASTKGAPTTTTAVLTTASGSTATIGTPTKTSPPKTTNEALTTTIGPITTTEALATISSSIAATKILTTSAPTTTSDTPTTSTLTTTTEAPSTTNSPATEALTTTSNSKTATEAPIISFPTTTIETPTTTSTLTTTTAPPTTTGTPAKTTEAPIFESALTTTTESPTTTSTIITTTLITTSDRRTIAESLTKISAESNTIADPSTSTPTTTNKTAFISNPTKTTESPTSASATETKAANTIGAPTTITEASNSGHFTSTTVVVTKTINPTSIETLNTTSPSRTTTEATTTTSTSITTTEPLTTATLGLTTISKVLTSATPIVTITGLSARSPPTTETFSGTETISPTSTASPITFANSPTSPSNTAPVPIITTNSPASSMTAAVPAPVVTNYLESSTMETTPVSVGRKSLVSSTTEVTTIIVGTGFPTSSTMAAVTVNSPTATAGAVSTPVARTVFGTITSTEAPTTAQLSRINGTVGILIRIVFPNLKSVPSESEILNLANTLLDSPAGVLNSPLKVDNATYEILSDNSFAVRQSYQIPNVSMSENTELRNETENLIQRTVNDLLNAILNKPEGNPFVFPRANYTNLPNHIQANVEYIYQEGDINPPSNFLSAILTVSGLASTTAPTTTTSVAQTVFGTVSTAEAATTTEPRRITGTVGISIRLVFPNLKSVPSESEILNLANTLLDSPAGVLNSPLKVDNATYEILSDNSFAVRQSYQIPNVSMSENTELRNETENLIQRTVNDLLNAILNKPEGNPFVFPRANYTNLPNHIQANVEYIYQEGDINPPSNFLSAILTVSGLASTTAPTMTTSVAQTVFGTMSTTEAATTTEPRRITGTVGISIRLVFPNLKSVPSESEILNLANTLLDSPAGVLNSPLKVDNATYEILSDSSFAIRQSYQIPNVSMSENTELRNETENLIQRTVNDLLNAILNKPEGNPFVFPRANYTNLPNHIQANVEYIYQEGDINPPSNFLSAILTVSGLASTTAPTTTTSVAQTVFGTMSTTEAATTTEPRRITGTVGISIRLVFPNLKSVPSESEILNLANTLLDSPAGVLNSPLKVDNATYEKLSDSSFAVRQSYQIPNMSMSENTELRNETENLIQRTVNDLLNAILNKPEGNPFVFPRANYTNLPNHIQANVEYIYQEGDINRPSNFLSAILTVSGLASTTAPTTTTSVAQTVFGTMSTTEAATTTEPRRITGTVGISIRLVFPNLKSVPSESEILNLANTLLDSPAGVLNSPLKVDNATYEKLSDSSFAVRQSYQIRNVSMSENTELRNETENLIQRTVNDLLNAILNKPEGNPFVFPRANYTNLPNHIQANVEYIYQEGDINPPSNFLSAILTVSGLATTTAPTTTTSVAQTVFGTMSTTEAATTTEPRRITGTVGISIRLVFPNLKSVPSESEILNLANTLLDSPAGVLNSPLKVDNATYEKLSDSSFAVRQSYQIPNVSMSENTELRNETENLIQRTVNDLLNAILNKPEGNPFVFPRANYTNLPNHIQANVEYIYQEGDINRPSNFLSAILTVSGLATTTAPTTTTSVAQTVFGTMSTTEAATTTEPRRITGTVGISIRLVFPNLKSVPSESEILNLANTLLDSPAGVLNSPLKVDNATYEILSDSSFAVRQSYQIPNVSMSENTELRNETENLIQRTVNDLLNAILNKPEGNPFVFPRANYTNLPNHIQANVEYIYQEGDINRPSNFLSAILTVSGLATTTAPTTTTSVAQTVFGSMSTTEAATTTEPRRITGTVGISIRLVFPNLKSVPSESEILNLANTLPDSPAGVLNSPLKVDNATYEILSDNSFAIRQSYQIPNVSMSENTELRNETENLIQRTVNDLLNAILNKPEGNPFVFPRANYTNLPNHIQANVEYIYQEGDINPPSNFLSAILTVSGLATTTAPTMTTSVAQTVFGTMSTTEAATTTEPRRITGTVGISIRLVFPNLKSVPSESEILNLANTLLDSPAGVLNSPLKVDNATYEILSDNSFAVRQSYQIPNVSMSENTELRNETENLIQRTVNDLLNAILNKPEGNPFVFPRANYTNLPNHIQANVEYIYQEGDINRPSNFLSAILTVSGLATTTAPTTTTSVAQTVFGTMSTTEAATTTEPRRITGTVGISIRLVFPNLKSVPSESEILNLANTLLDSPAGVLNSPLKVDNATYEKLSDSSFAVRQSYQIPNVSMSENTELRNETENLIQRTVNDLLNAILNKPEGNPFVFPRANYTNLPNHIQANVEYIYQEGDINPPSNFLSAILTVSGLASTTAPTTTTSVAQTVFGTMSTTEAATTTEPRRITGTVGISIRLVFPNLKSVPSESEILNLANTLLDSPAGVLNSPLKVDNATYEKLSDNSFAVRQSYQIPNVSMSENTELRNETENLIQRTVNDLLNAILNKPEGNPFVFPRANYTNLPNHIQANVEYIYQEGDINRPSNFLSAILTVSGLATTTAPTPTTSVAQKVSGTMSSTGAATSTGPRRIYGIVVIFIRFVFYTIKPVPTESEILSLANNLLDARVRQLNPVKLDNVTSEKLSDNSFAINLSYQISNVSMSERIELRNETENLVEDSVNNLLNIMLNQPDANPFVFPKPNYVNMPRQIQANLTYVFREGDIKQPSTFLSAVLEIIGLATTAAPTTTTSPVLLLITGSGGAFPGWALAIIIPCGILIILVPFWILLCCLLCGCCAAIKRRFRRRRGYNVQQYRIHTLSGMYPEQQYRTHPL